MRRNADQARHHAEATSRAMKLLAERRKCRFCGRKNALRWILEGEVRIGAACRWCKIEKLFRTPESA